MKKVLKFGLLLFSILLLYGCVNLFTLSDLRVDGYHYPSNPEKAKQLFQAMGEAHQIENWQHVNTYQVIYGDEFYGFLGKQAHPFKEHDMTFALDYITESFDGQLEIISGEEKGTIWGIQSGQTYQKDKSDQVTQKKNKDMKFWIPTYKYFIEFPKRIQEANVIDYLGTGTIDGIKVEGVIASWTSVSPQKNLDQYVVWMNADTKQIVKIEYTVRDTYRFVTGAAYYQDYKDFDGILLPTSMPVESNLLKEGFLHKMTIQDFKANHVSAEELSPLEL